MRSSSGIHYLALDHVRALAAWLVFMWHFNHGATGVPVPFGELPVFFPFALVNEGHTGVALFMTLSGYLFGRLIGNRAIHYRAFLWNRALRLLPLLVLVMLLAGWLHLRHGGLPQDYLTVLAQGWLLPTWPNGGWSITVELHFYVLLPLALWLVRETRWGVPIALAALIGIRSVLYAMNGGVFIEAYFTLLGRADQFLLGLLVAQNAQLWRHHRQFAPKVAALAAIALVSVFAMFNAMGGLMKTPSFPSTSPIWIGLCTLEGLCYATLIGWYAERPSVNRCAGIGSRLSQGWAKFGQYSYSLYLLHFFYVFDLATWLHTQWLDLSNFYLATLVGSICFLLSGLMAFVSYHAIESPFLRWRKPYTSD